MKKIIRITTVPISLNKLLEGQLGFLNNHFEVIAVSSPGNDLKLVSKRENINCKEISIERKISIKKDIVSLYLLYKFFKQEKPQIVHSITPKAGLLSMTAAFFAKVPTRIHTFTGLIFPSKTGIFQKILILMDKLLCFFATNIYPEGNGVKNDLINFKITNKPLKILANGNINGINPNYFNPENYSEKEKTTLKISLNISKNDFVFIFVGRLVSDKGINELIKAFNLLKAKHKTSFPLGRIEDGIKLLLVGALETALDPLKKETLLEINNNQNIISVGYQQNVRPYLAIANALTFPSYREGFPNVVLQASAMNLPCIVTDINGCNEIITHNYNGLIIPIKEVTELSNAMKELLINTELKEQLIKNSRPNIVAKYQQQVVWEALLKEYNTLLTSNNL